MLRVLREIYATSLREVYIYALVAACIAFIFTFGMEWLNLIEASKKDVGLKRSKSKSSARDRKSFHEIV